MQFIDTRDIIDAFQLADGRYLLHRMKDGKDEMAVMTKEKWEIFQKEHHLTVPNMPDLTVPIPFWGGGTTVPTVPTVPTVTTTDGSLRIPKTMVSSTLLTGTITDATTTASLDATFKEAKHTL